MKFTTITSKITLLALVIVLFSATVSQAKCICGKTTEHSLHKEEILAKKLTSTLLQHSELVKMEETLLSEGIVSMNSDIEVKILNESDELIYEGSYNGIEAQDKTLKRYMDQADLLMNDGNTVYYMVF